jgi:hypothetical protein
MILPLLLLLAADPKQALTFRATFDKGPDADFAKGDKSIYFAPSYKDQASAVKGLGQAPVALENGALRFKSKHTTALFFKIQDNVNPTTGTISFKLKLDPALDLPPDYVDPIQFTDKAYNDSALWVDFTKDEKPRLFRLGVFGELKAWNPTNLPPDKNPKFNERLVVVKNSPFSREQWTHIVITYATGTASLYINGKLQGNSSPITEPFTWDLAKATIRLGVNYAGLMDDISIYNRVLTPKEISKLK